MRRVGIRLAVLGVAIVLGAQTANAQAIAGVVKDGSGAVLPGVTVEASSPALIERTRSVQTDNTGQYKIVDLSLGTYTVTFSLSGFKTVRRAEILLEGNFIAQVNADLQVGAMEETLTVTATSPTVDVINSRVAFVLNREALDEIPVARRDLTARAALIPGTTVTFFTLGQYNMTIHGSAASDMTIAVDGMRLNNLCGSGQYSGFYLNDASTQEITYLTGAENAEVSSGGMRINVVPKDGGNTFAGTFFAYGATGPLQADNRSEAIKPFIPTPPGIDYDYQVNPSFGGPVKKDKLWFYFTYKYADYQRFVAGANFPDGTPVGQKSMGNYSAITRLTWQAASKDKVRLYLDRQFNGEFYNNVSAQISPEASHDAKGGGWTPQIKWTRAQSARLLFDAGYTLYDQPYSNEYRPTVGPYDLPHLETTTNKLTVAGSNPYTSWTKNNGVAGSMSYITGAHAFKTGMTLGWGTNSSTRSANGQITQLNFNNDQPLSVTVRNTPYTATQKVKSDLGTYAQDTWTMSRLTLNIGGRYDHFNAEVPTESSPPVAWVTFARNFPAIPNVPKWNDWAIRLAGAYDLFGDGRTALKGNASRYLASEAAGYASGFNPMGSASETRAWRDVDGNRSILDASGNIQYNEVAPGTANFGAFNGTTRPDPDLARGYNWEYSAVLQREIAPRVSVTGGYYRRQYYNLRINDNQNLNLNDWTSFTFTSPVDARFPNGGGETITAYTLNPAKNGVASDTLQTFSGVNKTVYDGFEVSTNSRLGKALVFGGVTTERTQSTACDGSTSTVNPNARDNPNGLRFCDNNAPTATKVFRTTIKASASYTLPYDVLVSASFLARPGSNVNANYTVTSAIAQRPIIGSTAGTPSITVNLIEPNTLFLPYQNQLDGRVGRNFKFGRFKTQGFVDVFNLLNAGTATTASNTYGSNPATNTWLRPTAILLGRYARFGLQMNF
jgi:Carboxypeptidase regulatory-like domain